MAEYIVHGDKASWGPKVGVPIASPEMQKGQACQAVCEQISRVSEACWVETKYDGFRMQIHIDLTLERQEQIKFFGKDRRDRTKYRTEVIAYHPSSAKVNGQNHSRGFGVGYGECKV
jgi:ATP-dependent DNA ligase